MARKPALRAVQEGDVAPREQMSVLQAAESGDYLDELLAMRRTIARRLDNPNTRPADIASLTRRQLEITKEIRAITADKGDPIASAVATPDEAWTAT